MGRGGVLRGVEVSQASAPRATSASAAQTLPRQATPAREPWSRSTASPVTTRRLKTANLLLDKADAEQVVQLGGDLGKGRRAAAKPGDAAGGHAAAGQRHV